MQLVIRAFANMAVGKKMLLGFGLVILLTLAVVATGFFAVDAIRSRGDQMIEVSKVNAAILDIRALERGFALSRDPKAADALRQQLQALKAEIDRLHGAADAGEQAALRQIREAVLAYEKQFERYTLLLGKAGEARVAMGEAALESRDQFDTIEMDMYDEVRVMRLEGDRLKGSDPLTLAETASGLSKRMLDLRGHESQYIIDTSEESVQNWQEIYDDLSTIARNLTVWLNDSQKESIEAALVALDTYRSSFANFRQTRSDLMASEREMANQSQAVMAAADGLLNNATADVQQAQARSYMTLSVIGVLATLIGIFASFVITRLIVSPLRYTVELAQKVAAGDLSQAQVASGRRDELGQLQDAMQSMTGNLRSLVGSIGSGVGQIATAADQLSSITAQTSRGVQNQREETEQTATAMHQMAATVQEVARNAEQASEAARQADREARQGDLVVREAVSEIGNLAHEVEQTAEAIVALNEESGRIGSVLEVIRSVAEQTNLLALNAAIEAARAGEQGRGFAVVADEVRALAMRTHTSTEEIEGLIANLQRVAQKAVEKMDSSRSLTQRTVTLAGEAGSALGRITDAVSTIEQMNQQIAAAAEEQSVVAETINESVTRVRDIGEQSATASHQIAGSSAELARLGGDLQGLVGRFRT
ncbi:methyl-accepting chemotaxis protein [Stutzerimonas nosocomialis]|uniref:Methyl-accepting chemotaxis protein n=1 Tax=Stutzerimonas nosocomialis TaxID=1056496 RepID=A0A5R9QA07_9GAMM|nr:methyl-accepting chemotaxis protein [Stutzerimonas nosocomialis]TLX61956.1 methyl-accepting chemotaxis protein [Stutzerimonas nosocomialis]